MEEKIRAFFDNFQQEIEQLSTINEIAKLAGFADITRRNGWAEQGSVNLIEIYLNALRLFGMFENYQKYEDTPEQFMYDVTAILDDTAYHATIFGVYWLLITQILEVKTNNKVNQTSHVISEIAKKEHYDEKLIQEIAATWDLKGINKTKALQGILSISYDLTTLIELLVSPGSTHEIQLIYIYKLYASLLSLQMIVCEIKSYKYGGEGKGAG